ncbi:hypothetical protein KFE98_03185 [bacterium SCSIO 12741]|nr:hypothetical protein KFE98_03185 [bacterium SCSIO 12741]
MKSSISAMSFVGFLLVAVAFIGCQSGPTAEKSQKAEAYYEQVANMTFQVNQQCYQMLQVFSQVTDMPPEEREDGIELCRVEIEELSLLTEEAMQKLEKMEEFDEDVRLRDSQIERLKFLNQISDQEFERFVTLMAEDASPEVKKQVMSLLFEFMEDMIDMETMSVKTYQKFAKKYDIERDPNEKLDLLHAGAFLGTNKFIAE